MSTTIESEYVASANRYMGNMKFRKSGESGLILPVLSLGFWWNFGAVDPLAESKGKMLYAFDNGIYCFDLANNYGPPYGSAEETFGTIYERNLKPYRNELVITTKAGYDMWAGPTGTGSSRRMLITSLEQSLKRMRLDYVDIFYSHRYDANVPLEETMLALYDIVRSGKAIYVGLSNYPAKELKCCLDLLKELKVPCIIYQGRHNLFARDNEKDIESVLQKYGIGYTAFSPLAKGVLTDKYLHGIPEDSRAFLGKHFDLNDINKSKIDKVKLLNEIADSRSQSMAQMAISWLINRDKMTSVIIGPRTMQQLKEMIEAVNRIEFTPEEIKIIDKITFDK